MENQDPLIFTLDRAERPVTISNEDYVLIELDGKERDRYLNGLAKRIRTSPDGKSQTVKEFDGLQGSLIVASLRKVTPEGLRPVDIKTVQTWPARVVKGLFQAAKDLSALNDDEDENSEGND